MEGPLHLLSPPLATAALALPPHRSALRCPSRCLPAGVWGIFSLTGEEHPEGKNPYNTLVMVSDKGTTDLVYRKVSGGECSACGALPRMACLLCTALACACACACVQGHCRAIAAG